MVMKTLAMRVLFLVCYYRPNPLNGAPGAKGLNGWPGRARLKYCWGVIGFGGFGYFGGMGGLGKPGILLNGICLKCIGVLHVGPL